MAYPHKWSPISYKSSAGQRKHTGQRPMLYRWTTPPTKAGIGCRAEHCHVQCRSLAPYCGIRKGKERKSIYIAPFLAKDVHLKHSGMDHTVLPANNTMPAFPSWCSPDDTPQQLRQRTSNCSSVLIYRPQRDERLRWPSWLTYSGWFTHISGNPSATGRAQDSESTPAKDRQIRENKTDHLPSYCLTLTRR